LIILFGGIRMILMRSYALCLVASILATTPCLSPTGCCCLGNVVGIWGLVVLLSPDVRDAFR
jgi:hypothetical protein